MSKLEYLICLLSRNQGPTFWSNFVKPSEFRLIRYFVRALGKALQNTVDVICDRFRHISQTLLRLTNFLTIIVFYQLGTRFYALFWVFLLYYVCFYLLSYPFEDSQRKVRSLKFRPTFFWIFCIPGPNLKILYVCCVQTWKLFVVPYISSIHSRFDDLLL